MKWFLRIAGVLIAVLVVLFLVFRTPDTDPEEMRAKYGGPPSQFVTIASGLDVHLRDEGTGEGLPIVLLHGSNADLHTWEPWVERLRKAHRVIRFDQVGHGLTGPDPQSDYSRANFASDIAEVLDALGVERAIIGGNSMGGKHALAFAVGYPERVAGLILVDASGAPMPEEEDDGDEDTGNIGFTIARTPGINAIVEQITPRPLIRQSLEESVSNQAVVTEEVVDRYWELLRYPGNRAATMGRFSTPYDGLTESEIASIGAPTLILWGDEDRLIPVSAGRWLDDTMPDSELVVYSGIGHLPHEEAPEDTLEAVETWLANLKVTN
ncbi:MAG: alpha/beta hydrolase [Erythrobacter sp.]|uniref:alpha/beta fold hydrolase n=1 Tax=Erythrobacter sp. TaxID=1042 RepID=UPI002615636B|nr:alpha/beta hydrolase [Erythrobacter sp.]MDJ0976983.1 alpha/beta hydrolase [Erythrobacter sp.]